MHIIVMLKRVMVICDAHHSYVKKVMVICDAHHSYVKKGHGHM